MQLHLTHRAESALAKLESLAVWAREDLYGLLWHVCAALRGLHGAQSSAASHVRLQRCQASLRLPSSLWCCWLACKPIQQLE